MRSACVIARRLNHRVIELEDETREQTVGVLRRNGEVRFMPWLGFIDVDSAKAMASATPVKLVAYRVGVRNRTGTTWYDLGPDEYVQGCLVKKGVYAVAEAQVRLV